MKELIFIGTTKTLPTCIKFLYNNIRVNRVIIVSPDSDVAVISLNQSVTNLTFLDALWFKTSTGDDQIYIPKHVLASELELPICCLLPAMIQDMT